LRIQSRTMHAGNGIGKHNQPEKDKRPSTC
jgi:hypothetical protein